MRAWIAALALLAGCARCQREPAERYKPTGSTTGVDPGAKEVYGSVGPWTEPTGPGEFGVVERGRELKLYRAGKELYAGKYPVLYRLESSHLVRVELPDAGPINKRRWEIDNVWEEADKGTSLWIDEERIYGSSSPLAKFFRLENGKWVEDRSVAATEKSGMYWNRPFSDSRELRYDKPDGGELLAVLQSDGGALPQLPIRDSYDHRILVRNGRLVFVSNGARANDAKYTVDAVLVETWDGARWTDDGAQLDGMSVANAALLDDGTVYVLLAENGNGYGGGHSSQRGPTPSGELSRRAPDGKWERLVFPCYELPKWTCLRFAPFDFDVTADGAVWVTGKWFYSRHPTPTSLEFFEYGAVFRRGATKDAEVVEVEPN
jgi:hypothetical protein